MASESSMWSAVARNYFRWLAFCLALTFFGCSPDETGTPNALIVGVLPDEKSEAVTIRVSDFNHPSDVTDDGNATFSIRPKINITSPVLDENVVVGSNNTAFIAWNVGGSTKISNVDIEYSVDGGTYTAIAACTGVLRFRIIPV